METLGSENRVIAVDLRGHGGSDKPHHAGSYGLEMLRDVLRLMDHLEIGRAHVVGYSMGGTLALKLLEFAPERLLTVVLGGADWINDEESAHPKWVPIAALMEKIKPGELISSYFWPNQSQRPPREVLDIVDDNDPAALAALAQGMLHLTLSEHALRLNRVPLLAVYGEHDPARASGEAMQDVAGNYTLLVAPGLDHHTLAGSDEFRNAIRKFTSHQT
jgi:pimeloyl-ACP methyl ester carboxylesterase